MHIPTSPRPPTPSQVAHARSIVESPDAYSNKPALRAFAWEILLRERGHRMNTDRVSALQEPLRRVQMNIARNEPHSLHRPSFAARLFRPAFHDDVTPDFGPNFNGAA